MDDRQASGGVRQQADTHIVPDFVRKQPPDSALLRYRTTGSMRSSFQLALGPRRPSRPWRPNPPSAGFRAQGIVP